MARLNSSPTFRRDIEGLRGIAVFTVVAFHCGMPGFSGGFIGVDIFFVLSGYLITGLLEAEIQKKSRLDLFRFYARRVRRLLPASALVLFVTLLLSALLLAPAELALAAKAALASALYASNIYFSRATADYFAADSSSNPLLHTWSLAVEEQFYFFWPLLIMAGLQLAKSRRALLWILGVVTVASFALCVWTTVNMPVFAFYQIPARAWEFGIGGLGAIAIRKCPRALVMPLAWGGLACILGSVMRIEGGVGFPGWIALLPAVATTSILVAGSGLEWILNSAPLQFLGKMSYSWYLWHWPFLVLAEAVYPNISLPAKAAAAAAALVAAYVSHKLVENPIRFHPLLMESPSRSLGMGLLLSALSVAACFATVRFAGRLEASPEMQRVAAVAKGHLESPLRRCIVTGDSSELKTCEFGDPKGTFRVVLFGDSHAYHWIHAVKAIAEARGWHLTTLLKSGCAAADISQPMVGPKFHRECGAWRQAAIQRIIEMHPSAVITGNSAGHLWRIKAEQTPEYVRHWLEEWREANRRSLQKLTAAGLPVAQIRDNPRFHFDVPTCVARTVRHSWYPQNTCSMPREIALDESMHQAEVDAATGLTGVAFVDLSEQFCDSKTCPSVKDGEILYSDVAHLAPEFTLRLKGSFEEALRKALGVQ